VPALAKFEEQVTRFAGEMEAQKAVIVALTRERNRSAAEPELYMAKVEELKAAAFEMERLTLAHAEARRQVAFTKRQMKIIGKRDQVDRVSALINRRVKTAERLEDALKTAANYYRQLFQDSEAILAAWPSPSLPENGLKFALIQQLTEEFIYKVSATVNQIGMPGPDTLPGARCYDDRMRGLPDKLEGISERLKRDAPCLVDIVAGTRHPVSWQPIAVDNLPADDDDVIFTEDEAAAVETPAESEDGKVVSVSEIEATRPRKVVLGSVS
jgi:hypothetical protein